MPSIRERDRQRRGSDALRLEDRQSRDAAVLEHNSIHADLSLRELGALAICVDGRVGGDRNGGREPRGFEGQRHLAGRNRRRDGVPLFFHRRLVSRDDLGDLEPARPAHLDVLEQPFPRTRSRLGDAVNQRSRGEGVLGRGDDPLLETTPLGRPEEVGNGCGRNPGPQPDPAIDTPLIVNDRVHIGHEL
jgi:hypothetical protein